MKEKLDYLTKLAMLDVALEEARLGMAEGGIPIGAALFDKNGAVIGRGHNRRVQENDPSVHGETDAFRKAGRQRRYQDTIMSRTTTISTGIERETIQREQHDAAHARSNLGAALALFRFH